MNKYLLICTLFLIPLAADIHSTRDVLAHYTDNHALTIKRYDRICAKWIEYYDHSGEIWDLNTLLKAVEYAAEKHAGQVKGDKNQTPYITHPIGVAEILWNVGEIRSINVLIAAILHETLQCTNATAGELLTLFGPRVLKTVEEVSYSPELSWEESQQWQIDCAKNLSLDGQLLQLADRLYNIRDLTPLPYTWSPQKVDQYYDWTKKLLEQLKGTNSMLEAYLTQLLNNHFYNQTDR